MIFRKEEEHFACDSHLERYDHRLILLKVIDTTNFVVCKTPDDVFK